MGEAPKAYLLNDEGKVEAVEPEDAADLLATGYTPAGKKQIEDFKKEEAFRARYETAGQQAATFAEGTGQSLTAGLSTWLEKGLLGVKPEDIKARQEINPGWHTAGSITGVALPLIATAGASALPEAVGEGAELTAPALISKAGEAASEGVEHLLGEHAASLAGRVAKKAAAAAAGGFTEGTAYGVGQVVHESALGDPNLTAAHVMEEIGLSGLLGGGIAGTTGALGQLIGEAANSKLGVKLEEWLDNAEARSNLGQAAGGQNIRAQLKRDVKNFGWDNVNQMAREGRDLGLGAPLSSAESNFDRAMELKEEASTAMSATKGAVDASPEGMAAAPSAAKVAATARQKILAPLKDNFADTGTAAKVEHVIEEFENKFGAGNPENKMSFSQLHEARQTLDKSIYGLKGDLTISNDFKNALHDFRNVVSDEITSGLEKIPGEAAKDWADANRKYQLASFFQKYADAGMLGQKGNNVLPVSTWAPALAGLIHGGPLGGAALGLGGFLAKRYGPGMLAEGARFARKFVEEGAAEGLASKTAEAIAEAREAASEAGASTRAGQLWSRLTEKVGEPVGGPAKDLLRDTAQEHLAERSVEDKAEGTPMESVAALSHLEAINQRHTAKLHEAAGALVSGAAHAGRIEAGRALSEKALGQHMAKVQELASDPAVMQRHLETLTQDMHEHAPNVAQALQVGAVRTLNVLQAGMPKERMLGALGPTLKPSKEEKATFQRRLQVLDKPSKLLEHAAKGTLTPDLIATVAQAQPHALQEIQQAVLEKVAAQKGPVPYRTKLMLGMLLGQPVDGTASPQSIAASQAVYAMPSAKSGQDATGPGALGKTTQGGLAKLDIAGRAQLPGQAADSRRRKAV